MSSFVGRLAGRVASGGAAAALVNANQPAAQARAPAQVADRAPQHSAPRKSLDEEWLLTDFDRETLLFKPFKPDEIECAITEVMAMATAAAPSRAAAAAGPSVWIEEGDGVPGVSAAAHTRRSSDAGTADTSESGTADAVIEQAHIAGGRERTVAGGAGQAQLNALLTITSRLMRRPGFQHEVVACMLEEAEVRDLMLGLNKHNQLDAYLQAVGIHTPGLLPPPTTAAMEAVTRAGGSHSIDADADDENVVDKLLHAMAAVLEKTNEALAGLGGWLRNRASDLGSLLASKLGLKSEEQHEEEEEEEEAVGGHGAQGRARNGSAGRRTPDTMDTVLGAVMVVAVGVLCMLLTRRPVVRLAGTAAMAGVASRVNSSRR